MTTLTLKHPLHAAADLVEKYIATLDDSHTTCECCDKITWNNWPAHKAVQELGPLAVKLRRFADADSVR